MRSGTSPLSLRSLYKGQGGNPGKGEKGVSRDLSLASLFLFTLFFPSFFPLPLSASSQHFFLLSLSQLQLQLQLQVISSSATTTRDKTEKNYRKSALASARAGCCHHTPSSHRTTEKTTEQEQDAIVMLLRKTTHHTRATVIRQATVREDKRALLKVVARDEACALRALLQHASAAPCCIGTGRRKSP